MDKSTTKTMFSRKSDNWGTPQHVFDVISNRFGPFNLDPCGGIDGPKLCETVFTENEDGLKQSWAGKSAFINPPYSQTKKWIDKALRESCASDTFRAVFLIPARTDTKMFHQFIIPFAQEVCLVKGRIKFVGGVNTAPFPSMIVVFEEYKRRIGVGINCFVPKFSTISFKR